MGQLAVLACILIFCFSCTHKEQNPLEKIISQDEYLAEMVSDPEKEVQILYTRVIDSGSDDLQFLQYSINLDSSRYFYPASTVKLPTALLALEKINELQIEGLDMHTTMLIDSAFAGQSAQWSDTSNIDNRPTIAHYIRKILIASDNDAYNRLYEFLGQDFIHERLATRHYSDTRIRHRLSIRLSNEENSYFNPIRFVNDSVLISQEALRKARVDYFDSERQPKGIGYMLNDTLVKSPMEFQDKNFFPLDEQHRMLKSLIYPAYFSESSFNLTARQRDFFLSNMSSLPRESGIDIYRDEDEFYDAYVKFLMYGDTKESIPSHIRIYNKIGLAYGYAIDNAFIRDQKNDVKFFLSVVIHTNENQIFNDGIYEYEETAFPFLARLGRKIYEYELSKL